MRPIFYTLALMCVLMLLTTIVASQNAIAINLTGDQDRVRLDFPNIEQAVHVCGLLPNKSYKIWAGQPNCSPKLKLTNTSAAFAPSASFQAQASCIDITIKKDETSFACANDAVWFSIGCLDCNKKGDGLLSKISTQPVLNPQNLLDDIFLGGQCYEVSNLTAIGASIGRGSFSDGTSSIGIQEGVILSTGNIALAAGPNNDDQIGYYNGGPTADPDLNIYASQNIFDVQGLEFDFVPTATNVSFEYVFASEEYCEYVNAGLSDLFGFFISGPGINGGFSFNGENIALVPNSNLFVSVDNVNQVDNTAYFVPNRPNCGATTNMTDIQFDGWTSVLTATADVIPCETYHIRLVIADVNDGIFDSAIFLGAGTFNAGSDPELGNIEPITGSPQVIEGCDPAFFTFTRAAGSDINSDVPIELNLTAASTAVAGVDFQALPATVMIPAGQMSVTVPVGIISDNLLEGMETIQISVTHNCECTNQTYTIEVNDPPMLMATLPIVEVCEGISTTVQASITGGVSGSTYSYLWSNGQTSPSISITPTDAEIIAVTITDQCGTSVNASTQANVTPIPSANLTAGGGSFCLENSNDTHPITLEITGVPNWLLNYTIDGLSQSPILITSSPYTFVATQAGNYQFTTVSSQNGGCSGTATGQSTIAFNDLATLVSTSPITCAATSSMTISTTCGSLPYNYLWSNGAPNAPSASGLPAGNYEVTVSDAIGCTSLATGTITAANSILATAIGSQVDCNNPNSGAITLNVGGGTAPYSFTWSNGLPSTQNQTGLGVGNYSVTINDSGGCNATASASITASNAPPVAIAQSLDTLDCDAILVTVSGQGSQIGTGITYAWSGPGLVGDSSNLEIEAAASGTYTITVTDTGTGCSSTASTIVESDLTPPLASVVGGAITCTDSSIILNGAGSSAGSGFQYEWNGPGVIAGGNTLQPTVNAGGSYVLTVINLENGCESTAIAQVDLNTTAPAALIAQHGQLDCETSSVLLDGSGSSSGTNFQYQWSLNGSVIPNSTSSTLTTSLSGNYNLEVTNLENGCRSQISTSVVIDTVPPVALALVSGQLDCSQNSVQLLGSAPGNVADYSFNWTTIDGTFEGSTSSQNTIATAAGTYVLSVVDLNNGCLDTAIVQVEQSIEQPIVDIQAAGNLDCNTTTIALDGTGSSQGQGFSFTWSTVDGSFFAGQNTLSPTVDAPGTYVLNIVNNATQCQSQGSVTVTALAAPPIISFADAPNLDCSTNSVSLNATIGNVPGNANLTFVWTTQNGNISGASDSATAIATAPGIYELMVVNEQNGCSTLDSVLVEEDLDSPNVQIANPNPITCTDSIITLNASGSDFGPNFTLQWSTLNGNFVGDTSSLTTQIDLPGTYNLLIINEMNHCESNAQIEVTVDFAQPNAVINPALVLTCETPEIQLNGSGSSIGGQFLYNWTGPNGWEEENTLNPTVNTAGAYQLLVTNQTNGCTASTTVTVNDDLAAPTAEAGATAELSCQQPSISLNGTGSSFGGNFTYLWTTTNGSIIGDESTLNPIINAPGDYQLLVTDTTNGCLSTDYVQITSANDLPVVAIAAASILTCQTNEVVLDGFGSTVGPDISYTWSTTDGLFVSTQDSLNATVSEPGTYFLTVTNSTSNCSSIGSVIVESDTVLPFVNAGQVGLLNCSETTLTLNGNGSDFGAQYIYNWTTQDGNILEDEHSLTPRIDEPGTYVLQVINTSTGCANSDAVLVTQDTLSPIAVASSPDMLTCAVTSVQINGQGSSVGTNFNYSWATTNGQIVSGQNTPTPIVDEPGIYVLTVTNTSNHCSQTASLTVLEDVDLPDAIASANGQITCSSDNLTMNASGSSTGNNYSFEWTTTNGHIVSGADTQNPVVDEAGTYVLMVFDSTNGCSDTANLVILADTISPIVSIAPPGEITCTIEQISLQSIISPSNCSLFWTTNGGNIVSGETTAAPIVDAPGSYILTVQNPANGCTNEVQTFVNQNIIPPTADAGNAFSLGCNGQESDLDGGASTGLGSLDFSWNTNDGLLLDGADQAQPTIGAPGTYELVVTSTINGCSDIDEVVVKLDELVASIQIIQPSCLQNTGVISFEGVAGGSLPYQYSIDGGNSFSNASVFPNLPPNTYSLTVSDANGCTVTDQAVLLAASGLQLDLEAQVTIELGESYQINATTNIPLDSLVLIEWTPTTSLTCSDCLNPSANPYFSMNYTLHIEDNNGCEANAPIQIIVKKDNDVYVPNAFSPNDDGINDVFMVFSNIDIPVTVKKFMVFTRWGESVYQQFNFLPNDPNYGWDGWYRGKAMDPAVFAWFAEVEFLDGSKKLLKGDVTLVK
ncbi:MAG: choice-of-anchor L domain-containing protein [Saprospiraceae bacterium]|nr:choice-of-anchor L domain-containing protein [Saprospiraceae bacterium]